MLIDTQSRFYIQNATDEEYYTGTQENFGVDRDSPATASSRDRG